MNCKLLRFVMFTLSLLAIPTFVNAQVNGSGPSDSALFDIVINLPPAPDIGSVQTIGGVTDQTTQLNVMDGGSVVFGFDAQSGSEVNISGGNVGGCFDAFFGSEVNISGGTVGGGFDANSGSEVNISGGTVGGGFDAESGSVVTISGGTVSAAFDAQSGSDVELIGGEFLLNGDPFTGSSITLVDGDDVFTGTLQDGSAFVFSPLSIDTLSGVTLTTVALPTLDTTPRVVNTDISAGPSGLRAGQSLTLQDGGVLGDNFAAVDATLNIEGGVAGPAMETARSTVNISGGEVGFGFEALSGSCLLYTSPSPRDS